MKRATVTVSGMHCGGCVSSVERVLGRLPGVAERAVAVGSVEITFDEALLDEAALRAAIDDAGFEVTSVSYA